MPAEKIDYSLSVDVFQHPDEFPPDVQQLFAMGESESVEFGTSWYRNLVNAVYPDHGGVRIYVLRKQGRPVAALPVRATKTAFGQRVESLSNYYTSIYAPLIEGELKACDMVPLIRAVKEAHAPLGSLRFAPMDPESTSYRTLLGALEASGLSSFGFFCFGNWYLRVNDDWKTYLKNREGTLRSTIKRMTKKFAAKGGTLELVLGGASLDRGLAAYEHVYASSWKKAEPYSKFIPGLVRTCAERGWLRLGVAWLNGEPIAAQIWIVANGKANIYKLAFDENYRTYVPGTLLTAMLMEHAMEKDRVEEVDYLIGDDPYKKSWMNHRRERWGIMAYNPKSVSGLLGLGREVLGRSLKPSIALMQTAMQYGNTSRESTLMLTENDFCWQFFPATEFASMAKKWQLLCDRYVGSPLLSADFIEVALRHFGRGNELICFAETKSGLVAATILQRKNWLVWETFQPSQMPLGSWLYLRQLDLTTVLQSLRRALPVPTMILGVTQLDSLFWPQPTGKAFLTLDCITTGEIDLPENCDEFVQSLNSKPFNRRMRKAEKDVGPISLVTQTEPAAVDAYVNLFASMESRGWKGAAGTALAPGDAQSDFYADLLRRFAATGRARMFTLKMGDRDVAAQIAITENGVLYLLKTTYEPELRSLGPGVILHYFITLYGYEQEKRIKRIEFYGPLNDSQKMWITGSRSIYHVNTYRSSLLAKAHGHLMDRQTRRERATAVEDPRPAAAE